MLVVEDRTVMARVTLSTLILLIGSVNSRATNVPASSKPEPSFVNSTINDYLATFLSGLSTLEDVAPHVDDPVCRKSLELVLASQRELRGWAVKFYDASAKLPVGVLAGSVYQLGNFDECLEIGRDEDDDEDEDVVSARYCLAEVDVDAPEVDERLDRSMWRSFRKSTARRGARFNKIYWALCVPAVCRADVLERALRKVLEVNFELSNWRLDVAVPEDSCYANAPVPLSNGDVIYATVVLSVLSVIVIATTFHLICLRSKGKVPDGLLPSSLIAFSLISNMQKLMSPAHNNELYLDCIAGIKFISMVFIIAGHTLIHVMSGPIYNKKYLETALTKVENSIFTNGTLLVDTFFLVGGFLFCRILIFELDRRKSASVHLIYLVRYLRLTPAYVAVLGFYITWLTRLDTGPLWSRIVVEQRRCLESWWTNVLYINNYVNTDKLCMFQSWYLAVDTQLFLLAPAVIYPLWRWRRLGEGILAVCTLVSILIPFVVTLVNDQDPTLMFYISEMKDIQSNKYFVENYVKTHMKATSYCFGLISGYVVYRMQTYDHRFSQRTYRIGWTICALSMIASMFSIVLFYDTKQNVYFTAAYASLHKVLWSAGVSWVLIACITQKSVFRQILRWRLFVPLSRLTYSAYLVNGIVVLHSLATTRNPQYLSTVTLFLIVIGQVVLTFLGGLVLTMTFESPILSLERVFLRQRKSSSENEPKRPNEDLAEQTSRSTLESAK